jgi:hypothetical protein
VILDALAVGRQHSARHAELYDRTPEFYDRGLDVLDWQQGHPFKPRVLAYEFFMQPVVVGSASRDRPMDGNKPSHSEAKGRIEHAPRDSGLVEKLNPLIGTRILQPGAAPSRPQIVKMQMIEVGKYL